MYLSIDLVCYYINFKVVYEKKDLFNLNQKNDINIADAWFN